jgi:hypothetical protein
MASKNYNFVMIFACLLAEKSSRSITVVPARGDARQLAQVRPFIGPMRLKESHENGVVIFALSGAIDLHYAPTLRSLFQSKLNERCPALIVDLNAVDFID